MENLIHGLGDLGTTSAIAYLLAGALIGVIVGVIPGLGTPVVLSILLIFVYHIDLTGTLCLFLGAQCGSFYAASVSSILLNTPAHPEAFPITFDGYPMARKGEPGRALGLSAASTFIGGLIGCGVLIALLQVINQVPTLFHPPEYVALVTLAMLLVGTVHTDSIGKTVASAGAGLMLASVGASPVTGDYRFTFSNPNLVSGISTVALVLGVFAIPQMVMVFGTGTSSTREDLFGRKLEDAKPVHIGPGYWREVTGGVVETFRHWPVLLQSGLVGGITGIIPGIGGFTGNFMAYGIARQLSRKKDKFGTGIPDGIIAPEGSSLAKEAGHIIPIIGLGIPGGVAGALFIGALAIKNIKIGEGFQQAYPNVTGEIVWIIAITGLIGTLLGVLFGAQIAKVTRIPGPLLVPFVFILCVTGPYFTEQTFFSVVEVLVFALVGLAFRRLGYPLGTFIMGVILGPTFETNISLTKNIYPGASFILHRPLADVLFAICLVILAVKAREIRLAARRNNEAVTAELTRSGAVATPAERRRVRRRADSAHPVLSLLVTVILLGFALFVMVYGSQNYNFDTVVMPFIGALCIAAHCLVSLPRDVGRFTDYLRDRQGGGAERPDADGLPDAGGLPGASGLPDADGLLVGAAAPSVIEELAAVSGVPDSPAALGEASDPGMLSAPVPVPASAQAPAEQLRPIVDGSWGRNGQYRRELIAFALLCGLMALCWLIGFPPGIGIFFVVYGLICLRRYLRSTRVKVAFTVAAVAVTYLVGYEMFQLAYISFIPKL
jgi:putative tricarboxylic transport membrane protein